MPKKHVYSKDTHGFGDFVYVDLLPEVRRSRQFNVNVIIALLYAIVLGFFLIYRPYSTAVFELENLNSINSDREHELVLTQEEFDGYEIDVDAIDFQNDIDTANAIRINFNNLIDDVREQASINQGTIEYVGYQAQSNELIIRVSFPSQYYYNNLNTAILGIPWVDSSTPVAEVHSDNTYSYYIGVDYYAE